MQQRHPDARRFRPRQRISGEAHLTMPLYLLSYNQEKGQLDLASVLRRPTTGPPVGASREHGEAAAGREPDDHRQ
jgi:hypothetical protein